MYAAYRYRHRLSRLLRGDGAGDDSSDAGGGYSNDIIKAETARLSHMASARDSYAEAQAKVASPGWGGGDDDGAANVSPLGGAVSRRLIRNRSDKAVAADDDALGTLATTPRLKRTSSSGYGRLEDGL